MPDCLTNAQLFDPLTSLYNRMALYGAYNPSSMYNGALGGLGAAGYGYGNPLLNPLFDGFGGLGTASAGLLGTGGYGGVGAAGGMLNPLASMGLNPAAAATTMVGFNPYGGGAGGFNMPFNNGIGDGGGGGLFPSLNGNSNSNNNNFVHTGSARQYRRHDRRNNYGGGYSMDDSIGRPIPIGGCNNGGYSSRRGGGGCSDNSSNNKNKEKKN